jgi:hypothetical protein
MLNIKTTILIITAGYMSFSCIPESDQRIKNDKGNYSITKLANWDYEIKNRSIMITQTREFDSLALPGTIIIAPGNSELSLDDTFTALKNDLPNSLKDFQKINEGYTEINGHPTRWLKLSYLYHDQEFISLRYYLMLSVSTPVMIDCSSNKETFEDFEQDFNKMVFSFRVEN